MTSSQEVGMLTTLFVRRHCFLHTGFAQAAKSAGEQCRRPCAFVNKLSSSKEVIFSKTEKRGWSI